jgi:hypothetical protein
VCSKALLLHPSLSCSRAVACRSIANQVSMRLT